MNSKLDSDSPHSLLINNVLVIMYAEPAHTTLDGLSLPLKQDSQ